MPFPSTKMQIPTSIRSITVILLDPNGIADNMSARYIIQVLDQNNENIDFYGRDGNLIPHLTAGQKQGLANFMQAMRVKANKDLLGFDVMEAGGIANDQMFGTAKLNFNISDPGGIISQELFGDPIVSTSG